MPKQKPRTWSRSDLIQGKTVGMWTVISKRVVFVRDAKDKKKGYKGDPYVICQCTCGIIRKVRTANLVNGSSKSCLSCNRSGARNKKWTGTGCVPFFAVYRAAVGAKRRGIKFCVTREYLSNLYDKQNGRCALTGQKISFSSKDNKRVRSTASLDRINSSCSYTRGNVQWVHKDVNRMKWKFSDDEFVKICRMVVKNNKN